MGAENQLESSARTILTLNHLGHFSSLKNKFKKKRKKRNKGRSGSTHLFSALRMQKYPDLFSSSIAWSTGHVLFQRQSRLPKETLSQ